MKYHQNLKQTIKSCEKDYEKLLRNCCIRYSYKMQRLKPHVVEEQFIDLYSLFILYISTLKTIFNYRTNLWKYRWIEFFAQPSNKNKSITSFTKKKKQESDRSHTKREEEKLQVCGPSLRRGTREQVSRFYLYQRQLSLIHIPHDHPF